MDRQDLEWPEERYWYLAEPRATMKEIRLVFRDIPSEDVNRAVKSAVEETRIHIPHDGWTGDTNVLVSAVRADSGPSATIREGWLGLCV